MSDDRLLILGLGNVLMGDDGIGIHIINELKKLNLPDSIDVIDGGTPGIELIDMLSTYRNVILVDAIKYWKGDSAGIKVVLPDDIRYREDDDYSAHDIELTSVLRLMRTLDLAMPEIKIIGMPAYNISPAIGISEECKRFIPEAIEFIMEISGSKIKNDFMHSENA
ncbi:MAG: hydrogenase maturation protease [Nitrospirae bacterium]|nr:hydrogenase maturation protease [Nitrospirota bacterium]